MADPFETLRACEEFEWDDHNAGKNWRRHGVLPTECEALFFNRPLVVRDDAGHSKTERRYYALGQTDAGRALFVVFTVRGRRIRVISARDMSRKERRVYRSHEQDEETP